MRNMNTTKEKILLTSLRLFARDGYEAVSVSMIAQELGMAKSALYKHYTGKRDIFLQIVARMEQMDQEQASRFELPTAALPRQKTAYEQARLDQISRFSLAQFCYWTEDEFPCLFRQLLTLEQYRSPEMSRLYQQYLAAGPVGYLRDLLAEMIVQKAAAYQLALELYGPMFLLYSIYDGSDDKSLPKSLLQEHCQQFSQRLRQERRLKQPEYK